MLTCCRALMLATLAMLMFGCGPENKKAAAPPAKSDNAKSENTKTCMMQADGKDVLKLSVAKDATCTPKDGSLIVKLKNDQFNVWLAKGAKSVDEAVGKVGEQIKEEFKDFKTTSTKDLTIAGGPAKQLLGDGIEVDDGDDGKADVIVFKVGAHVFVALVYGEALNPAAQELMLKVVQTAQPAS